MRRRGDDAATDADCAARGAGGRRGWRLAVCFGVGSGGGGAGAGGSAAIGSCTAGPAWRLLGEDLLQCLFRRRLTSSRSA